ncbi:MAG: hypothetical protein IJI66_10490 [Erysipelotrichaceae bacterium]|nr:hypothetical protein [Erysipelotrichaceae bacterium]
MKLVDAEKFAKEFPINSENYDKENGDEHFVFGVETVLESLENAEEVYAISVDWLGEWFTHHLPRSYWWIVKHIIRDWKNENKHEKSNNCGNKIFQ